jgi:hypothetical protein
MHVWYRWHRIYVRHHPEGTHEIGGYDPTPSWSASACHTECGAIYRSKLKHDNPGDAILEVALQIDAEKERKRETKRQWRAFRKTHRGAC